MKRLRCGAAVRRWSTPTCTIGGAVHSRGRVPLTGEVAYSSGVADDAWSVRARLPCECSDQWVHRCVPLGGCGPTQLKALTLDCGRLALPCVLGLCCGKIHGATTQALCSSPALHAGAEATRHRHPGPTVRRRAHLAHIRPPRPRRTRPGCDRRPHHTPHRTTLPPPPGPVQPSAISPHRSIARGLAASRWPCGSNRAHGCPGAARGRLWAPHAAGQGALSGGCASRPVGVPPSTRHSRPRSPSLGRAQA